MIWSSESHGRTETELKNGRRSRGADSHGGKGILFTRGRKVCTRDETYQSHARFILQKYLFLIFTLQCPNCLSKA